MMDLVTLVNRTLNDIETTTMFQLNALLLTSLCPDFIAPAGESPGKYRLSLYSFPPTDISSLSCSRSSKRVLIYIIRSLTEPLDLARRYKYRASTVDCTNISMSWKWYLRSQ